MNTSLTGAIKTLLIHIASGAILTHDFSTRIEENNWEAFMPERVSFRMMMKIKWFKLLT